MIALPMVSILVFLDLGLWRPLMRSILWQSEKFQSLFFWIWGSGVTILKSVGDELPVSILVFLDLGLWLYSPDTFVNAIYRFQSLFFWIWGSGHLTLKLFRSDVVFQSLFFWIWGSGGRAPARRRGRPRGFNPCFSGSGALARTQNHLLAPQADVSILVFLDLGLWLPC